MDSAVGTSMGTAQGQNLGRSRRCSAWTHLFVVRVVGYVNLCPNRIYLLLYREKSRAGGYALSRPRIMALVNGQMEIVTMKSLVRTKDFFHCSGRYAKQIPVNNRGLPQN
ncbi:MAG: hypothetical protein K0S39_1756 [Paenibacillus sp.]|nr:hypothetical protein [Paenibacillus sp.]